jgi:5-formyltetrahydrofolate cyclo-ligase
VFGGSVDKSVLRSEFKTKRKNFVQSQSKSLLDHKLADQLRSILEKNPGTWVAYLAKGDEANPWDAVTSHSKIRWAFPVVEGQTLKLLIPENLDQFQEGSWGISEPHPQHSKPIRVSECQGVLVPGVAFDQNGRRLGSGKGFFDRLLNEFSGLKVGIAYSVQIASQPLPEEEHDVRMDYLATENNLLLVV